MLSLSILERTNNSIIYEIPAGKPDPQQKCTVDGDVRDRVMQAASKGNTCWYYTLNFIRRRIGDGLSEDFSEGRKIEKLCSQRRKAQTNHDNSLPAIAGQLQNQLGRDTLGGIDLEKAKFLIENREKLQPIIDTPETLEGSPSLFPFIEEFLKERNCRNMHEFLLIKKFSVLNQINIKFLSDFGISVEKLFEEETSEEHGYTKINWEELNVLEKAGFLDFFARDVSAKAYGLKKSSWTPLKRIEGLIEELKKNGPLYIGGAFGRPAYIDEPFKIGQKLAGREIYAWQKGAKRHPITFSAHSVLIVGAKKIQDNALVYFIDSLDPSDPKDLSKQKIYVISFTNLSLHICDLHGRVRKDSPVPYAYYGNFKI